MLHGVIAGLNKYSLCQKLHFRFCKQDFWYVVHANENILLKRFQKQIEKDQL